MSPGYKEKEINHAKSKQRVNGNLKRIVEKENERKK